MRGRGVFATQTLSVGEIATFYPMDAISGQLSHQSVDDLKKNPVIYLFSNRTTDAFKQAIAKDYKNFREYGETYANPCNKSLNILYSGDPNIDDDPSLLGHLINDPNGPHGMSRKKANCHIISSFYGIHSAILVTRTISQNQELFLDYGPGYIWE